jgi:hypothetical protein
MGVEQTVSTRNQSTANFDTKRLFIFDNRYVMGVFKNTQAVPAPYDIEAGVLVVRDTATPGGFKPATSANLADVIGISAYEGKTTLVNGATASLNVCTKGTVEPLYLKFPAGVTLDTAVGNKTLFDVIESLGIHLQQGTVEMTEYDN